MEGRKKNPSLPSNYVTLLQLQEKWLREKERKQREKELEEEQQRQRQVREEEERRRRRQQLELQQRQIEREEMKKREIENPVVQKLGIKFKHRNHNGGMNRPNRRVVSRENLKTAAAICAKQEKPEVEASEADSRNENAEKEGNGLKMFKKKHKKKKKGKKKKEDDLAKPSAEVDATNPRAEGDMTESTAHALEGNLEVVVRGSKHAPAEDRWTGNSRARKIGEKKRMTVECKPKTGNLDLILGIEHKIRDISVNGKSERGNDGFRRPNTGGRRSFDSSFGRQEVGKHNGAGMVWVKKGEVSNGITREFRSQVASERTDALSGSH